MSTPTVDVRMFKGIDNVMLFSFEFDNVKYLLRNDRVTTFGFECIVADSNNNKIHNHTYIYDLFSLAKVEDMFMCKDGRRFRIVVSGREE